MIGKKLLASWNRICPGCNFARKHPESFLGRLVIAHWEAGCPCHKAYLEVYGKGEPSGDNEKRMEEAGTRPPGN